MKAIYNIPKEGIKAIFKVDKYIKVEDLEGFATSENLTDEILRATARENEIDGKLDGININLTKQIDDLEKDANDKYNELTRDIDDLTDVVEEDFSKLDNKITTTSQTINTRITDVADEINQSIEENVVALQGEDNALQSQINSHSQTITEISEELSEKISRVEAEHLISQIQQFKHEIVNSLPEIGSSSIMYLVPKQNNPNVYEEWIWLEDEQRYEDIGSTAIDLSEYAKLTDIPTEIATVTQLVTLSTQTARYDLSNVSANIDYVISEQTYGGGESGKRKWKNGRFEQWGVATTSDVGEVEFAIHEAFRDMLFSVFVEPREKGNFFHYAYPSAVRKFKTRTTDMTGTPRAIKVQWRAYGYWK